MNWLRNLNTQKPTLDEILNNTVSNSGHLDLEGTQTIIETVQKQKNGPFDVANLVLKKLARSESESEVYNCLLLVEKLMGSSEEFIKCVEQPQFQRVFVKIPERFPVGVACEKTLALAEKWALTYAPVIALYPNFERTYEYLFVNRATSPVAKQNDLPPDTVPESAVASNNDALVGDDSIPATINGKLAAWYLDKLQSDFQIVASKSGEMQYNLNNESCRENENMWNEIQQQRLWLTQARLRLQELLNEVLDEPAIMQAILELSEVINSLDEWVSCLEEDRPFSGKTDHDTKAMLSLITLVNPDTSSTSEPSKPSKNPIIDLNAPDIKREDLAPSLINQTSPQILTPKEDLTAEFDVPDEVKREPAPKMGRTPFNSVAESPGPQPNILDINDIFKGLDNPKRGPDSTSNPKTLPPLAKTPVNTPAISAQNKPPTAIPDNLIAFDVTLTPNNSVKTDHDSPSNSIPTSPSLPSDALFPDLLLQGADTSEVLNNLSTENSNPPASKASSNAPVSIIPDSTKAPASTAPPKSITTTAAPAIHDTAEDDSSP